MSFFRFWGAAGSTALAAVFSASAVYAMPMVNNKCVDSTPLTCAVDGGDLFTGLDTMAYPGGTYLVPNSGNDTEVTVEAALNFVTGSFVNVMGVETNIDDSNYNASMSDFVLTPGAIADDNSVSWSYTGSETLSYLTLKSATGFVIYDISGQTMGVATTDAFFISGGGMPQAISHIGFWKTVGGTGGPPPTVSEPGIVALAAAGFGGMVWMRRRSAA